MKPYFLDDSQKSKLKPAICAIILKDSKILFIKRAKGDLGAGYWTPVTGSVLLGEKFIDAVHREIEEEVKLKVEIIREIWQCPTSNNEFLLHWWLVNWVSGEVIPEPTEVEDFRWVSVPEILNLRPVFDDTTYFFQEIFPDITRA